MNKFSLGDGMQPWSRFLGALILVAVAATLQVWPLQALGSGIAYLTFFPAVAVAAIVGGFSAGMVAMVLACLAVGLMLPLPVSGPPGPGPNDWLGMAVFALGCVLVSGIAEGMRRASTRAKMQQQKAEASAQAAADSERFIKSIADNMPGMVAYWDKDMVCRFANKPYLEWFGKAPEAVVGRTIRDLMGARLFALNEPHIREALLGYTQKFERTLTKADGSIGHTWANYIPDINESGLVAGFFVLVTDVTQLKKAEAEQKLAASVLHNTVEGIFITDAAGIIQSVNPAFTRITGYSAEEAIGQTPRMLKSNHHDRTFHESVWSDITNNGQWQGEIWNRRKSGDVFLVWQTITKISNSDDASVRYVSLFHDVTDVWREGEQIRHQAFHDALTGLPNRSLLIERLERRLAMHDREPQVLAVMFLDLDHFKLVNDTLGHDMGDELLKTVATRLTGLVRLTDTVARLGGDEFIIKLDNPASSEEVMHIAQRIIATVNEPMTFRSKEVRVGTSIGIAMFPADGATPGELIMNADSAMYAAKLAGKNAYRFFGDTAATPNRELF